jgi:glycolate oxidase
MITAPPLIPVLEQLAAFKNIVGEPYVFVEEEVLQHYAHDETEDLHFLPDVVIKPRTAEEISAILKICHQHKIPVTPRGGGTGLSGGALPHLGGVLLSIERLNNIIKIDERNLQVIAEAGGLQVIEQWRRADVRPGRQDEQWLNALARKSV